MIKKKLAHEIRELSLNAISELSKILYISEGQCLDEEYELVKKGVGLSIGRIQTGLLDLMNSYYSEEDDLKE
ncbi:conserved hypothetical protein [Desulfatibacillum aliphaticivorans]|uniref:Uncharacterized protein n=1 Tax=Desulfatibacillum aliphaticivorans TaxID=218208 RepID=B8FMA1_DESAL|nr:conserved hypothetical protein [Desulfatibacillum aliphaticivorans]